MPSNHKTVGAAEVGRAGINGFHTPGWLAGIEAPRVAVYLVEQGEGAEDRMVGKSTASKDHAGGANEAVSTNGDWLTVLAVVVQVDGVAEELGPIAGNGREGADADAVGAVDVVTLGNGAMGTKQKLCASIRLVIKVGGASPCGKSCDPVATADGGSFPQLKKIQVHRDCQRVNAGARGHGEAAGVNPSKANMSCWVKPVAINSLEEKALQQPWKGYNSSLQGNREETKCAQSWKAKLR